LGCGVRATKVIYSRPFIDGKKLDGYLKGKAFHINDFYVKVRPTNVYRYDINYPDSSDLSMAYYWENKRRDPPLKRNRDVFFIELSVLSKNKIEINPNGFKLLMNNKVLTSSLYGPVKMGYSEGAITLSQGNLCDFHVLNQAKEIVWYHPDAFKPEDKLKIIHPLQLQANKEYCFAIKFNTPPPMPKSRFSLLLEGLNFEGKVVKVDFETIEYEHQVN